MPSKGAVIERMDQRVEKLVNGFEDYVRVFMESERFPGPSAYFYRKTLTRRQPPEHRVSA
jgi:hypothetical protein